MKRLIISVLFILSNFTLLLAQDPFCETIVVEGKSSLKMTPEIISFHINKLGNVSKIQYGEPRKIRNFTRTNYDLLTSQQLESASSTVRVCPKALNPAKMELRTTVMLAWGIKYE